MTLRLNGSTSGYTEIDAPAVAGSNTLVLPTGNGSSGQYLQTNGSGALSWSTSGLPAQALTSGTAVASTSGTSIDFTGIPSTVKRVTVMFSGVSTNGTSNLQIQIGTSSGVETSGYIGATGYGGSGATTWNTSGYLLYNIMAAANTLSGAATVTLLSSNTWTLTGLLAMNTFNGPCLSAGSKALSGTLDRIRITTVNGTDTFDAGSINILYEG
jgi:hypothetical protein